MITTILKPGKRANGKTMPLCGIVKRLITDIGCHWPHTIIIFLGDSHFSYPEVMIIKPTVGTAIDVLLLKLKF